LARDAEPAELLDAIADADAELEAAAGKDVDRRGVLRDPHWMVERQQQDGRADADLLRAHRDRGGLDERRGRMRVLAEVMLGQPDVVVADRLGPGDLIEHLGVEALVGRLPLSGISERVPKSEAKLRPLLGHRRSLLSRRSGVVARAYLSR